MTILLLLLYGNYGDAGSMYGLPQVTIVIWLSRPGSNQILPGPDREEGSFLNLNDFFVSLYMANAATAAAAAFGGALPPGVSGTNERCTIIASNLNEEKITEDKLFNLFSIYGNIVRIKILRNKSDHALIEMGDGFQAELAVHFLKVRCLEKQWRMQMLQFKRRRWMLCLRLYELQMLMLEDWIM